MEKSPFDRPAAAPALRGTLRIGTAAPPPRPSSRDLTEAFAAAERQRKAAEAAVLPLPEPAPAQPTEGERPLAAEATEPAQSAAPSPLPTAVVTRQDLTSAFAAAEQARLAAEAAENTPEVLPLPEAEDAPGDPALYRALLRVTGWGGDAGSGLSTGSAAAALLDWGEDNQAAHQDPDRLAEQIRLWVEAQDCCTQLELRQNWPAVAHHADELVQDLRPWAGRLEDAGSPNRRTDYSPVHWAAVKQAVEQALNGA